jgi:hypothetical protein
VTTTPAPQLDFLLTCEEAVSALTNSSACRALADVIQSGRSRSSGDFDGLLNAVQTEMER